MSNNYACPICKKQAKVEEVVGEEIPQTICENCGRFFNTHSSDHYFQRNIGLDRETKTKISGWIADQNRNGLVPRLSSEALKRATARPLPTVRRRLPYRLVQYQVRWYESRFHL